MSQAPSVTSLKSSKFIYLTSYLSSVRPSSLAFYWLQSFSLVLIFVAVNFSSSSNLSSSFATYLANPPLPLPNSMSLSFLVGAYYLMISSNLTSRAMVASLIPRQSPLGYSLPRWSISVCSSGYNPMPEQSIEFTMEQNLKPLSESQQSSATVAIAISSYTSYI